jgi:hypothetical protein
VLTSQSRQKPGGPLPPGFTKPLGPPSYYTVASIARTYYAPNLVTTYVTT